ncbi:hypothetical protein J4E93_008383 [Alternaria ventricosa]|uniref:uncharacterized protein n=1 Tax=Alternaria ventricosa TaxID=1187951 RepID=UPI0020C3766D|nr:uncharacterized protein J4E93_008383 [Alternaria ventricosa]KAI4640791.1 hypothetical protein J4E93_008383 [Alternaria ventricosa]
MENQVGAADTALAETRALVPVLHHLPVTKVRLAAFADHKSERPNMMPFRMLFGTMKEGKDKDCQVWILLQNDHADGRSPEQRFNIFDRLSKLRGAISAEEAVRLALPANAFKCLKKAGTMDMDQLRVVIKYYFIFKGVNTPVPWIVNGYFTTWLTTACKTAGEYAVKVAADSEKEKSRASAAQNAYSTKPSVSQSRPEGDGSVVMTHASPAQDAHAVKRSVSQSGIRAGSVVKVNGQPAVISPPVKLAKARRTPQPTPQRAPTVSMIPAVSKEPSLFIPEGDSLKRARTMTPDLPRKRVTTSTPPLRSSLPAGTARPSPPVMVNPGQDFLIHSDPVEADNSDAMDTSRTSSTRRGSPEVLVEKSPNSQSSIDFADAYRNALDKKSRCKENIMINKEKQEDVRDEIKTLETQLADMQVEGRELKEENRHIGVEMKHLRSSLTPKERAIFVLGGEVVKRATKWEGKGAKSENDSSEED